ncbi:hypothetical protein ACS0TY_035765 [Phlomoides rotata]
MEKSAATKAKNKFLKLIPKAAQAVATSFQKMQFSPRRDTRPDPHRLRPHHTKGFSGPLGPLIPAQARRKSRNFDTQEPTSPKVSCIGQIKHKKKASKKKFNPVLPPRPEKTKKNKGIFRRKADAPIDRAGEVESTPSLSHMRKFASSRETFANFDWTAAQIAPEEDRGFYSDGERGYSDDEDDVGIPFSAPILMAGGGGLDLEPRKEINLWKRRTMTPPAPLRLNTDGEN